MSTLFQQKKKIFFLQISSNYRGYLSRVLHRFQLERQSLINIYHSDTLVKSAHLWNCFASISTASTATATKRRSMFPEFLGEGIEKILGVSQLFYNQIVAETESIINRSQPLSTLSTLLIDERRWYIYIWRARLRVARRVVGEMTRGARSVRKAASLDFFINQF